MLHHFSFYPPLSIQAESLIGSMTDWFHRNGRVTQVFFVVGGYVMSRTMSGKRWDLKAVGIFLLQRYCRLGVPYLVAILLAILAWYMGDRWLSPEVVGHPPSWNRLLVHMVFLQDLLGIESFSAGLWFVCVIFQVGFVYVITLYVRDYVQRRMRVIRLGSGLDVSDMLGWLLAVGGLFYFNRDSRWDVCALYYYPYFFIGAVVHRSLGRSGAEWMFWLLMVLCAVGLWCDWRPRIFGAAVVGVLIFCSEKFGKDDRWSHDRWVTGLGRMSYSLFLVHYPVLLMVAALWMRFGWVSPWAGLSGLVVAMVASIGVAVFFYRWVEWPSARWSRRWKISAKN